MNKDKTLAAAKTLAANLPKGVDEPAWNKLNKYVIALAKEAAGWKNATVLKLAQDLAKVSAKLYVKAKAKTLSATDNTDAAEIATVLNGCKALPGVIDKQKS